MANLANFSSFRRILWKFTMGILLVLVAADCNTDYDDDSYSFSYDFTSEEKSSPTSGASETSSPTSGASVSEVSFSITLYNVEASDLDDATLESIKSRLATTLSVESSQITLVVSEGRRELSDMKYTWYRFLSTSAVLEVTVETYSGSRAESVRSIMTADGVDSTLVAIFQDAGLSVTYLEISDVEITEVHATTQTPSFYDSPTGQPTGIITLSPTQTLTPTLAPTLTLTQIPTMTPTPTPTQTGGTTKPLTSTLNPTQTSAQTGVPTEMDTDSFQTAAPTYLTITTQPTVVEFPAKVSFSVELEDVTSVDDIDDDSKTLIKTGFAELFSVDASQVILTFSEIESADRRFLASSVLVTVEIVDVAMATAETFEGIKDAAYGDGSMLAVFTDSGVTVSTISVSAIRIVELCVGKPGYYCLNETHQAFCGAGYYCPSSGLTGPLECQPGFYCPSYNQTEQISCDVGAYCPNNRTIEPTPCLLGSICVQSGRSSSQDCPSGYYCPDVLTKEVCGTGNYCPTRSTSPVTCDNLQFQTCPFQNMSSPISCTTDQSNGPKCYDSGESIYSCDSFYDADTKTLTYLCLCNDGWEGQYCHEITSIADSVAVKGNGLLYVQIFVPIAGVIVIALCFFSWYRFTFFQTYFQEKFQKCPHEDDIDDLEVVRIDGEDLEEQLFMPKGRNGAGLEDIHMSMLPAHSSEQQSKRLPASRAPPKKHSQSMNDSVTSDNTQKSYGSAMVQTNPNSFQGRGKQERQGPPALARPNFDRPVSPDRKRAVQAPPKTMQGSDRPSNSPDRMRKKNKAADNTAIPASFQAPFKDADRVASPQRMRPAQAPRKSLQRSERDTSNSIRGRRNSLDVSNKEKGNPDTRRSLDTMRSPDTRQSLEGKSAIVNSSVPSPESSRVQSPERVRAAQAPPKRLDRRASHSKTSHSTQHSFEASDMIHSSSINHSKPTPPNRKSSPTSTETSKQDLPELKKHASAAQSSSASSNALNSPSLPNVLKPSSPGRIRKNATQAPPKSLINSSKSLESSNHLNPSGSERITRNLSKSREPNKSNLDLI